MQLDLLLKQWFPTNGARTTGGKRRSSRRYAYFSFFSQKPEFTAFEFTYRVLFLNYFIFTYRNSCCFGTIRNTGHINRKSVVAVKTSIGLRELIRSNDCS